MARDGLLPRAFARVSPRSGAPTGSLTLLTALSVLMLAIYYVFRVDLKTALLIPSGAAVLVYVIGSSIRHQAPGPGRQAGASLDLAPIPLLVLPFVGPLAVVQAW